jgi:hypothetical protein
MRKEWLWTLGQLKIEIVVAKYLLISGDTVPSQSGRLKIE